MAYNKTTWVNGSVPADEDHLNNIENGIEGATQDAENAQSSADKAQESADNAQSMAEEAQSAADKAQETAESANTAAGDAQSAAEAAQDTADSAQAAAEKAQETADSANEAVSSEATERQSADSDLEEKIQENTDLIESLALESQVFTIDGILSVLADKPQQYTFAFSTSGTGGASLADNLILTGGDSQLAMRGVVSKNSTENSFDYLCFTGGGGRTMYVGRYTNGEVSVSKFTGTTL